MTHFTGNIPPDSLTGAIFAIEGIKGACTVLNGPTGCKFYHSAISDSRYIRSLSFDPLSYAEDFYFGQPRVPATYLDGHDYVFGSGEKLSGLLQSVMEKGFDLIAVINSPGAALIGDDLAGFLSREVKGIPCFAIENTGYSGGFGSGYQNAVIAALKAVGMRPRNTVKKAVNLLGLNIYQKYFENNYKALKTLLGHCGIEVICAPGAADGVEELSRAAEAGMNVVVYQEYGVAVAEMMQKACGIPYVTLNEGPPIGFDSAQCFVTQICGALGADPRNALTEIEKARARAYLFLARFSSLLGLPKGACFSVRAEASVCYALTKWLCGYLGMIPAAISVLHEEDRTFEHKLSEFLAGIRQEHALQNPLIKTPAQIIFADGSAIAGMRAEGQRCCGVEIALPSLGYLDITEKYLLGEQGALFLLEQIMNGLQFV